jgi:hypothetical protein
MSRIELGRGDVPGCDGVPAVVDATVAEAEPGQLPLQPRRRSDQQEAAVLPRGPPAGAGDRVQPGAVAGGQLGDINRPPGQSQTSKVNITSRKR